MKNVSSSVSPAGHTPTPWFSIDGELCGADGKPLPEADEENNKAFMLRAVNAYDHLLNEILLERDWLRHIRHEIQASASIMAGFDQAEKYLSAAIIKAEGK